MRFTEAICSKLQTWQEIVSSALSGRTKGALSQWRADDHTHYTVNSYHWQGMVAQVPGTRCGKIHNQGSAQVILMPPP